LLGAPAPTTLALNRIIVPAENKVVVAESNFRPFSQIVFQIDLGEQVWDQGEETWPQFRDRATQAYVAKLEERMESVGPVSFAPSTLAINHHWVEWAIAALAEGRSPGQIAKASTAAGQKFSGQAVDKGVRHVCDILDFNWAAVKARRDVTKRKKS